MTSGLQRSWASSTVFWGSADASVGDREPTAREGFKETEELAATDQALCARARRDPEAFGDLYERYADQIFRFVYSRIRDRQAAEDVVADVFFKALRAIDTCRPANGSFRPWLYRIAVNATTDHLSAQRPTVRLEQIGNEPDRDARVADQVELRWQIARVRTALESLKPAQRTAIGLKLGQDMHTSEIATCMGRSEGAVKLLIHRSLTTVRCQLQEIGQGVDRA